MRNNRWGKNSSNWKGGLVKRKCATCGKFFYVKRSRAERAKYCSRTCTRVALIIPFKDSSIEIALQGILRKILKGIE